MLKRLRLLPLVAVLIAGCGGTGHHVARSVAAGHPCAPANFYMQCALPPAPVGLAPGGTASAYGVDFGWSGISAARARALGARFGASYFSTDASKNWTAATVNAYHRVGLATVGVWETYANRATAGYGAGQADARAARAQAAAVGNTNRPIDFAIDFDATGPQVAAYFQGVHSVLGDRGNAYGGYYPLMWLCAHHLVGHTNWATYAWSGGRWPPASCAPLEQYLNGNAFDNDRAIAADYGQWPYTAPKPKPLLPVCYTHRITRSQCAAAKRQVASDRSAASSSLRAYDTRGCPVLSHRVTWFSTQLRKHPRAKTTSRRRALSLSRAAYRQRNCSTFSGRVAYFTAAAATTQKEN